MNLTMTVNLTTLSLEDLHALKVAIDGEFARRTGKSVTVSRGCEDYERPPGGALLYDRPAIGGDRNTCDWYPSLEAANAALLAMSGGRQVDDRNDGGKVLERLPGEPRLDHARLTGIRG